MYIQDTCKVHGKQCQREGAISRRESKKGLPHWEGFELSLERVWRSQEAKVQREHSRHGNANEETQSLEMEQEEGQ